MRTQKNANTPVLPIFAGQPAAAVAAPSASEERMTSYVTKEGETVFLDLC